MLKKENEILKRNLNLKNKKIKSSIKDKVSLVMVATLSKRALSHLTLVKPKTLLDWQRVIDFAQYNIKAVKTCIAAPNMNAYVERLIGTIRREALDHFLLFSEKQVKKIVSDFVDYYNKFRVHQGIGKTPDDLPFNKSGVIKKKAILQGLHHHYFRSSICCTFIFYC